MALSILVVHNCENLAQARRSTLDYIYCFERYASDNRYLYHRVMLPLTETITKTGWDAVIFDSTACGMVTIRPRERFHRIRETWAFLRDHPAIKIVFPQDDASHGALLDHWFSWMRVDGLFTVRPEKVDLIYPLTGQHADVVSTVSGFIDDATIEELRAFDKPHAKRRWTIGQRVTMYPAWGGRFARRKGEAALRLKAECERRGVPQSISTEPADVFLGDQWFRFLGDCRFVVGAEGGHGIWDPYGAIQDCVNDYVARHPDAAFEEIERNCFEGIDGRELFPGFAPRVLEAALLGCGQILMEGRYRDFIRPCEHYIPLKEDFSNMAEVFVAIENRDRVQDMVAASRRHLVESGRFRYATLVAEVMDYIRDTAKLKHRVPSYSAGTGADWSDIRLRHLRELRDALAIVGVEQEKLSEPYLTSWVERALGGQVTSHEQRAALGLPTLAANGQPSPSQTKTQNMTDDIRSHVVSKALDLLRAVDASPETLVPVTTALAADTARLAKVKELAPAHRALLLDLALKLIEAVDGTPEALVALGEATRVNPDLGQRLVATIAVAPGDVRSSLEGVLTMVADYLGSPPNRERTEMLHSIVETAVHSRVRGPVVRAIASAGLDKLRAAAGSNGNR